MRWIVTLIATFMMAFGVQAAELGDDGLHKASWMRDTFLDLSEDLEEAKAEGKRLMILVEQRGCIYCKKMHEEVFVVPEIAQYIEDNYFVLQGSNVELFTVAPYQLHLSSVAAVRRR